ncbi:Ribosomal protein S18 acetylase RimI [Ruegeria intermedia]|uniref:Ribosomal protein S18 acetylase RimI n=1 Tax=Ruegeria intermedia TaxID=996115 RepID=A0A1M4UVN8_9RHOB|nr:GNAT family N-acetyltransferase [Ruegeria intermedia]SHE60755.1 Ribosomal protein S18 acetylase RimI [Ruegeria intermedia]
MRNKRGISQTFSGAPKGTDIRRATLFDLFEMSRVLTRSIARLCAEDHGKDAAAIARWTANKTPQALRNYLADTEDEVWLLLKAGRLATVGALGGVKMGQGTGRITLNYVDPDFRGQGASSAMLSHLESRLSALGVTEARVTSTATARRFYLSRGWMDAGQPRAGRWIVGYPMRKSLHP